MSTAVAIVFAAAFIVAIKVSVGALERIARSIARVSSTLERLEGALPDGAGGTIVGAVLVVGGVLVADYLLRAFLRFAAGVSSGGLR